MLNRRPLLFISWVKTAAIVVVLPYSVAVAAAAPMRTESPLWLKKQPQLLLLMVPIEMHTLPKNICHSQSMIQAAVQTFSGVFAAGVVERGCWSIWSSERTSRPSNKHNVWLRFQLIIANTVIRTPLRTHVCSAVKNKKYTIKSDSNRIPIWSSI